ncbi:MAG: thiol oxidoreductase [Deltaproteobacteria bacterium]|nr:thiol oxidoreductase [Deltaproteobacteria bacterium]MDQ3296304.1 thiol oxidoreductase [Myxococcota bacterium]
MHTLVLGAAVAVLGACGDNLADDELRQGGARTVDDRTREAFTHPLPGLEDGQLERHRLGRGPFGFQWMAPQLGPLFNHDACVACHAGNGRGLSQIGPSVFGSQSLIRVSLASGTPSVPGGPVPVPEYGTQLQDHAVLGLPEVRVTLTWIDRNTQYGDGEPVTLREPRIVVTRPDGSALPPFDMSYRQAPPVFGLGLLEAVADDTLRALADPDDADGDGISGRVNEVWDEVARATRIGRFGHKASVATLVEQTAGAFVNDMGLTNRMFPEGDGMTDVSGMQLDQTIFFTATLAVPAAAPRDGAAVRGRGLFDDFGCASCHTPTLVTGDSHPIPQLRGQTIHPYTDLLLHDVGDDLTDARRDFLAEGVEWRTPPLWGLGLTMVVEPEATFLHDGRARTVAEAILWHGGEAEAAREAFRLATRRDREALIAFLATL